MPLETFKSAIGVHKIPELDDALYTVYGELSADLHAALDKEAEAIVSTMLNRLKNIEEARRLVVTEREKLEESSEAL